MKPYFQDKHIRLFNNSCRKGVINMERLYYQDNHISLYNSDCRSMSELKDESVQAVVTSPPY